MVHTASSSPSLAAAVIFIRSGNPAHLFLLLVRGNIDDIEACYPVSILENSREAPGVIRRPWGIRTRRQALLQLLGLLIILHGEGVEVSLASDLELDLVVLGVLLNAGD